MASDPFRPDPSGELRPVLALARMDCAATLSSQVDELLERAARRPGRAVDPDWWAMALQEPAVEFDDGWARRCGPALRRAGASRTLRHPRVGVTEITHGGSRRPESRSRVPRGPVPRSGAACSGSARRAGPVLVAAAVGALPTRRSRRATGRARRPVAGSGVVAGPSGSPPQRGTAPSGSALSGSVLSGSLASGTVLALLPVLAAASRALQSAGPGLLLVLSGLVVLAAVAVVTRVRTVRAARARAVAIRVRAAVLAAADRELIRRTLDVERAAGAGVRATPRRAGAGRAA